MTLTYEINKHDGTVETGELEGKLVLKGVIVNTRATNACHPVLSHFRTNPQFSSLIVEPHNAKNYRVSANGEINGSTVTVSKPENNVHIEFLAKNPEDGSVKDIIFRHRQPNQR